MAVAIAVALGGSLGALARHGLMTFVERHALTVFPWDVFVVNLSGCLLVGVTISALVDRHHTPEWLRLDSFSASLGLTRRSRRSRRTSMTSARHGNTSTSHSTCSGALAAACWR